MGAQGRRPTTGVNAAKEWAPEVVTDWGKLLSSRRMAHGYDKNQERKDEINRLGKDLARRAKRRCEWCEESEELRPYDAAPDDEPALDTLMLLCQRCRAVVDRKGPKQDPRTLRFLEGAVWHDEDVVARAARAALADVDAEWARDTLDMF